MLFFIVFALIYEHSKSDELFAAIIAIIIFGVVIVYAAWKSGSDDLVEYWEFAGLGHPYEKRVANSIDTLVETGEYMALHDILLPWGHAKSSQIDHVVFSKYGIFVIETKGYSGFIVGNSNSRQWKQFFHSSSYSFYNPIKQNEGHIKALMDGLRLPRSAFFNIVVFMGDAEFRFVLPDGVVNSARKVNDLIQSNTDKQRITIAQRDCALGRVMWHNRSFAPGAIEEHAEIIRRIYS